MSLGFNIPLSATPDQLKKDLDGAVSAVQNAGKQMGSATSGIGAQMALLNKKYDDAIIKTSQLAQKFGENSTAALKSAADAAKLRLQIEGLKQPLSNVAIGANGAIMRGFNPLSNSINQLTREMPAFTNSVQTGFMAISNNIPALADAIGQIKAANVDLAASGQPIKSVFGEVAKSFLSWNTAISLGITALTVFGPQLWDMAKGLGAVNEDTKIYIKISDEQTKSINTQIAALKERNSLLGISIKAAQNGVGVDQQTLTNERDKLKAYQQVNNQLIEQVKIRKAGLDVDTKGTTGPLKDMIIQSQSQLYLSSKQYEIDQENLKIYQSKVTAQAELVRQMDQELKLQHKLAKVTAPKQEAPIRITDVDYLKESRESLSKYSQEFTLVGKNSGLFLAAGFASVPGIDLVFKEKLDAMAASYAQFQSTMKNLALGAAGDLAFGIGEMLAGGDWGKTLKAQLASLMSQTANALIALGSAMAIVNPVGGGAMIAGGIGLKIAAGILSASGGNQGGGATTSGGFVSSGGGGMNFGGSDTGQSSYGKGTITDRIYGGDLLLIIDQAGRVKRR